MRVVKFEGANMREALANVKRELGSDAVIVSTRKVRRGLRSRFEVAAALDGDPPVMPTPSRDGGSRHGGAERQSSSQVATQLGDSEVAKIVAPLRSELRWLRTMMRASSERRNDGEVRDELRALRELFTASQQQVEPSLEEVATVHALAASSAAPVVALVGPTGVGKTTSIAKLAAQGALIAGQRIGVVTLDTYRIGAEEQMRQYAELIGIPLAVASSPQELVARVDELEGCDRIYIDTAGRSPRDTCAIRELRRALASLPGVEVHLTMAASTSREMIDAIYARYRAVGVTRILFTKIDEGEDLSELVRAPARLQTPVSYIATGQAVPEDLHQVTNSILLHLAVQSTQRVNAA